jgi:hypothetical protein
MVRDVWRPEFRTTGPSTHVRQLVQTAISKLRQNLGIDDASSVKASDATIIAALFLGHMANGLGDPEAFQMHRQGIRTMIDFRGGLDALGLDGMVKCSVLQYVDCMP